MREAILVSHDILCKRCVARRDGRMPHAAEDRLVAPLAELDSWTPIAI
jgi:hypothetical protein